MLDERGRLREKCSNSQYRRHLQQRQMTNVPSENNLEKTVTDPCPRVIRLPQFLIHLATCEGTLQRSSQSQSDTEDSVLIGSRTAALTTVL
jgi:hypothetical protein